jgi:hypothetical protein
VQQLATNVNPNGIMMMPTIEIILALNEGLDDVIQDVILPRGRLARLCHLAQP